MSESEERSTLIDVFEPREFPTRVDLWRVAIQIPTHPEMTDGGIVIPDDVRDDLEFATYVGQVRDMGPLCFQAVTRSQVDLKTANKFSIGDWVMFGKHAGEKFRLHHDGTLFVVMSDTEVIGVTDRPQDFDCMSM